MSSLSPGLVLPSLFGFWFLTLHLLFSFPARHTSADWTDPEVATRSPNLAKATANEVILRAGEALYVPEHWIHSIVNIGVSAQCNRCAVLVLVRGRLRA